MRVGWAEKVTTVGKKIETQGITLRVRAGDAVNSVPPAGGTFPSNEHF